MKKYTLSLFVFAFICFSFLGFNVKSTKAYDSGCIGSGLYSITTGQLCDNSQYGYSNYNNNYSNNYSYGCTSAGPFNIITGQYCDMSQYSNSYQNTYPYYNQPPIISGINGPQTLNVNQTGTWTVMVSNINSGNLTYSINWGDQPLYVNGANNNSSVYLPQQNATFTHAYTQTGTFSPIFTVTNSSGQSANTSLSVVVSGSSNYISPVIYSITPNYGPIGTQVTIYGTGFSSNYNNGCTNYYCGNGVMTNTVNFGGSVIQNVYSYNGTNLTFTVPTYTSSACLYSIPACYIPQSIVLPGTYPVSVTNTNGISNSINFTVTY